MKNMLIFGILKSWMIKIILSIQKLSTGLECSTLNPYKKFLMPNDAKGIRLLQEAAEAGEPLACLEIGKRYITGSLSILKQNIDLGIEWLEKAAHLGNPSGLYYLFEAYSKGKFIPQDQEKAEAYLAKALERNDKSAIRKNKFRRRQRERDNAPLPQLGDSHMAPAGFPSWPSEQAPMGESHSEVPYGAILQPGHYYYSLPAPQASESSLISPDLFEKVDELFHIPEEESEMLDVPQEYYNNFMKEVSGNSSEKPLDN